MIKSRGFLFQYISLTLVFLIFSLSEISSESLFLEYRSLGETSGTVPIDKTEYNPGDLVVIAGNSGNLVREGYRFSGWKSEINGVEVVLKEGDRIEIDHDKHILQADWKEIFDERDKPSFIRHTLGFWRRNSYKLLKPWNYDKDHNRDRKYPLVIALHGLTSARNHYYSPVIAGNDDHMRDYPCFYLAPNNSNKGWGDNARWVRQLISEVILNDYRIDESRIYLIGFSMGGSGSYLFASDFYREYGKLFAGIVRVAGMSQTGLPDPIAGKTSVWYHVGLSDSERIKNVAGEAYSFALNFPENEGAIESVEQDTLGDYDRRTKTLTLNGIDFFKMSEYSELGHSDFPFEDPQILQWLFKQRLGDR